MNSPGETGALRLHSEKTELLRALKGAAEEREELLALLAEMQDFYCGRRECWCGENSSGKKCIACRARTALGQPEVRHG